MKKFLSLIILILIQSSLAFAESYNIEAIDAYNEGINCYNEKDVAKSISLFRQAIKLDENFFEAYYNLAQVLASQGQIDEAIFMYTKADAIKPNDDLVSWALGELYYRKKNFAKSMFYLNKIPTSSEVSKKAKNLIALMSQEKAKQDALLAEKKAREMAAEKARKTTPLQPSWASGIPAPSGVVADSMGNIYVASFGENRVYKINSKGQKSLFVSENILKGPLGLAVDRQDNVYIANYLQGNILKVLPNGAPYVFVNIKKPYCIGISSNYLYVTEQEKNTIQQFPL